MEQLFSVTRGGEDILQPIDRKNKKKTFYILFNQFSKLYMGNLVKKCNLKMYLYLYNCIFLIDPWRCSS